MRAHSLRLAAIALVIGLTVSIACSGSDSMFGSGDGRVQVLLTDAPSDIIAEAHVTFSRVYLQSSDDDGASIDLMPPEATPLTFDLLQLRDGIQEQLANSKTPAGGYDQLRLVVDEAYVTLHKGYSFEDGSTTDTLFVPSGMQSGIKVQLAAPIEPKDGMLTIVVVDFDVDNNFKIQGDPNVVNGIRGIRFTPSVHEIHRDEVPDPEPTPL